MAATFDTSASNTSATTVSTAVNITIASNSNRVAICKVIWRQTGITISSVSGLGGTFTSLGASVNNGGNRVVQLFKLIAPSTGAGTVTVTFSDTWGADVAVVVESWYDADQTTGASDLTTATGSSTAPSSGAVPNVTSNDAVTAMEVHNSGGTSTCGQTNQHNADIGAGSWAAGYVLGASGSTVSWTEQFSAAWAVAAARVIGAAAAGYTLAVDSTSLAMAGQSIGTSFGLGVTYQGLSLSPSNITLIFDQAYTVPVTHTPLALEGQELPFILTQPGTAGQLTLQGQTVNLTWTGNYTMPVTAGEMALAGQTITFSFADSRVITVDSGSSVFGGSEVGLTIPFVSGGGRARTNRGRRYFKMFNIGR